MRVGMTAASHLRHVDLDQESTLFCMVWAVSHGRSISGRSHGEKTKEQQEENRCASVALPEPECCRMDVGATKIYVAVPVDRDPQPVRHFSTFTEDLHAVAA